jgi:S-(hydroxymethyl)glutathione dehydrogenase/alcohol dehydrogenase
MLATRAAILRAPNEGLSVEDVELEPPRAGEVLVRMGASGVCHSDLHVVEGEWQLPMPLVLGHEGAGVVEAIGDGVRDVAVGDHVVLSWFYPCRRCRACISGRAWACTGTRSGSCRLEDGTLRLRSRHGEELFQYLAIGTFAARAVVPEAACVPIPREVPFDVACLIGCGVTTGVGAVVNTARVEPGRAVAVIGCGGVGLSVVMGARLAGAHPIIAIDVEDDKLALAQEVGATHLVRGDGDVAAGVRQIAPDGADYAFEAIGLVPTIEMMPSLLARGGTAVMVGMTPEGERASFDVFSAVEANTSILGSNYGSAVAAIEFPRLARLYLDGRLPIDRLVSHRIALDEIDDAFAAMRRRERARSVVVY